MSQQPTPLEKNHLQRYKKPILLSIVIVIVAIVLVSPIIPIHYTVTETRTRNLRYSSEVYGIYNVPKIVNVTNEDSIGGSFSVTMNKWFNNPAYPLSGPERTLESTSSQSLYIDTGVTRAFHIPDDWIIISPMYSFTYSVSAPSTQENYNVTKTEYKSILTLIEGSLSH
jgi:hypothetical protein